MEENKEPQHNGKFQTPAEIKSALALFLTKAHGNYQKVVDHLRNMYVGEDNVEEVQQVMRNVNSFLATGETNRKEVKEPYLEQGRAIDKVYKEFFAPIIEGKDIVQQKLNKGAAAKAQKEQQERDRKAKEAQITDAINQFILNSSVKIAAAVSNEELLSIERLINLETANKSKYGDQLPLLIERCKELTEKVAEQKKLVKEKLALEEQLKKAEQAGDDAKMDELKNKQQEIDEKISENTVIVQETAANSIIMPTILPDEGEGTKARRTAWKAEIVDAKEAMKKASDMLEISLIPEKVRSALAMMKDTGVLKGKTEYVLNGIRYYEEKTY